MRRLFELIAVIALLCVWTGPALADAPALSAQPNIQPNPQGSTVGGSASATGGDAGAANVRSSEPITASSTNSAGPSGPAHGSTTAAGPGTTANVPTTASRSEPAAPDGSVPAANTTGPTADADASRTNVSTSDSRVRADLIANGRALFGGSSSGIGSVEDPTNASTCSTAEVSPGVPTDASLGTSCGAAPTFGSEDFSASGADRNGAAGGPSASTCLGADASAGMSPSAALGDGCSASTGANPSSGSSAGNTANGSNAVAGPYSRSAADLPTILGIANLPSTATAPASSALLGATLMVAGIALLRRSRRKNEGAVIPTALDASSPDAGTRRGARRSA